MISLFHAYVIQCLYSLPIKNILNIAKVTKRVNRLQTKEQFNMNKRPQFLQFLFCKRYKETFNLKMQ